MSPRRRDRLWLWLLQGCAALCLGLLALILAFLLFEAWPVLHSVGLVAFFTDPAWQPLEGLYNSLPMLWGSLFAVAGALLIAVPMGVLAALFMAGLAPQILAGLLSRVLQLLAGLPSVIYGFWGLMVLVPLIGRWQPPGASLLAASLVLAIMVMPTLALLVAQALREAGERHRLTAAALGLSPRATLFRLLLPACLPTVLTASVIQTTRALGETMAVLMVAGNVVQTPGSIFDPIRTLTSNIALETAYALGDHRAALFVSGLMLMLAVVGLGLLARRFKRDGLDFSYA